jgi:hypothetical protein
MAPGSHSGGRAHNYLQTQGRVEESRPRGLGWTEFRTLPSLEHNRAACLQVDCRLREVSSSRAVDTQTSSLSHEIANCEGC